MAEWVPVKTNHAIEVMALVVTLQEPLPQLLQRKVFKATENLAFELGMKSRQTLGSQQVLGPGVVIQFSGPSSDPAPGGYIFNSVIEEDAPGGGLASRPGEQIEIRGHQFIYRTWEYISWTWNLDRIKRLLTPFLTSSMDVVQFQSFRLEYLDRFAFDDNTIVPTSEGLLRPDSIALPPQSFGTSALWHSHTGLVVPQSDPTVTRIRFVNADVNSIKQDNEEFRTIAITTALEDRLSPNSPQPNDQTIWGIFGEMHDELKVLLADIITDEMADRIFLKGKNEHGK